jgi:hypothetical protein
MIAKTDSFIYIFTNFYPGFLTILTCLEPDEDEHECGSEKLPIYFIAFILQNLGEIEGLQFIEEGDRQLVSQLLADWNRFRAQQLQQQQTKTAQVANAPAASSNAATPPVPVGTQLKPRAMGMLQTARYNFLFIFRVVLDFKGPGWTYLIKWLINYEFRANLSFS